MQNKPTSYLSGAGAFGSNRENGDRLHAGSDLYATVGTEVYATDEGIIRKISDKFYRNVGAIEIKHKTWIGRYCEITSLPILKVGNMATQVTTYFIVNPNSISFFIKTDVTTRFMNIVSIGY